MSLFTPLPQLHNSVLDTVKLLKNVIHFYIQHLFIENALVKFLCLMYVVGSVELKISQGATKNILLTNRDLQSIAHNSA